MSHTPPPTAEPEVPAWRLIVTLGSAGAFAGFLLVFVFGMTAPTIRANKAAALQRAVQEVLHAPYRYDTLYVVDSALRRQPPVGVDPENAEQIYLGYSAADEPIGFAIAAGEPGFQDVIGLIFGYDPTTRTVLGMKVLESKETPGLGDKIEKDSTFVRQFDGARAPLVGVKQGRASGSDPAEVDMITGATISSRAVIRIINNALERFEPLIRMYAAGDP